MANLPRTQPWLPRFSNPLVVFFALWAPALFAQAGIPEWCRPLPRPEYKGLERVPVSDPWFEVYKVAPAVFAIYEPHQSEETISYLVTGEKKALLFDTGMGVSDLRKVTTELTRLPIVVLNSHTHDDHVGDNWQFQTILGMDTDFTRENARGSRQDAQAEVTPDQICGALPKGFDPRLMRPGPGRLRPTPMTGIVLIRVAGRWKCWPRPATRQMPSRFSIAPTGCSSLGTLIIPPPSGSTGLRPILTLTLSRFVAWPH